MTKVNMSEALKAYTKWQERKKADFDKWWNEVMAAAATGDEAAMEAALNKSIKYTAAEEAEYEAVYNAYLAELGDLITLTDEEVK